MSGHEEANSSGTVHKSPVAFSGPLPEADGIRFAPTQRKTPDDVADLRAGRFGGFLSGMIDVGEWIGFLAWAVVPLVATWAVARWLGLPHISRRIAVVAYATAFCAAGLFPLSEAMKLGIDLSGGTILVYQVEQPPPAGFRMDKMVAAINRRINPSGVTDVTVRAVGSSRVEITLPHASALDVERYKRILTSVGSLEFRILANRRDDAALIDQAERTFPNPVVEGGRTLARWVPIAAAEQAGFSPGGEIALRADPKGRLLVLVVNDRYNVTGDFLSRAESTIDTMGRPAVGFHFNEEGARRFSQLTGENLPAPDGFERRLAIILDGQVYSAPAIRSRISSNGIITGNFTRQQVDDLVAVLNAGSLPATLIKTPVSEMSVGPTLGQDTIRSGLLAIAVSMAAVLLFMAAYYRVAGLIADSAVILNMLLVVGAMSWLRGTWTLAGLAGLALTVGMAVDTNVLVYERLREEQERSPRLSVAVDNAFRRAFRTIFDAHVTTLLAGAVLYVIGSEQVKGFALTLILGLAANLFTAVFVCRLIFDILEQKHWVRHFGMWALLSRPQYDLVGKRFVAVAGSSAVILAGLVAVGLRGKGLLDIDFTGGTAAAIRLDKTTSTATVRRMAEKILPDVTVEELQLHGEPPGRHFLLRTPLQNPDQVKSLITREFHGLLAPSPFDRLDNFGGEIIRSTQEAALVAILASIVVIAVYLWIRFQNVLFGVATVVALVHDVLVVLGLVAMSRWLAGSALGNLLGIEEFRINLPVIAAFLTLVGYSINDTIVVFDRIREVRGHLQKITWKLINDAVNQTLSRTILTSFTTWLVSLILYLVGGEAIHGMAFCLVMGVIVGTYSSVYIASPVLIWFGGQGGGRPGLSEPAPAQADAKPLGQAAGKGDQPGSQTTPRFPSAG